MKELTLTEMQSLEAGSRVFACISQVSGGMSVLATVAAIGIFSIGPIGWAAFGLGAVSLISGAIADPYACG